MTIEKELQKLQHIRASKHLKKRIHALTLTLVDKDPGLSVPLFAFNRAVVFASLLFFLIVGSGIILTADMVRQEKAPVPPPMAEEHPIPTRLQIQSATIGAVKVTPTNTPTPSKITISPKPIAVTQRSSDTNWEKSMFSQVKKFFEDKLHRSSENSGRDK